MAYVEQHGITFRVRVRLPDRRIVTDSTHTSRRIAEDRATEIEIAQRRGHAYPARSRIRLADWIALWHADLQVEGTTAESYDGHVRRHILPALGETVLDDIDRPLIRSFLTGLRRTLSPKSVEDVMKVLSTILNEAVADGRLGHNPCTGLRWHAASRCRPIATPALVLQIASHLPHWSNQVLVVTAAYTGMRWGELIGLTRDNIDLSEGTVYIDPDHGAVEEIGNKLVAGKPKTAASAGRTIWLPPFLIELLTMVLDSHQQRYVFLGSRGAVQRRGTFGKAWRAAVTQVTRSPRNQRLRNITMHDMRHTHKTWMIEDNIPEVAQAARLGHRMTGIRAIYSHDTPLMHQNIITALQQRWETSGGPEFADHLKRIGKPAPIRIRSRWISLGGPSS